MKAFKQNKAAEPSRRGEASDARRNSPVSESTEIGPDDLLPRLREQGYDTESVTRRREWLEHKTGTSLQNVGSPSFDLKIARGNVENPIGVAQVPMGVAGPVLVHGAHARGLYYVPMATSEGALIRSYERGMVALTRAGGVQTAVLEDENHISPAFLFADIQAASQFKEWLPQHLPDLQAETAKTTRHGRLNSIKCRQVGRQVNVDLGFETGDAQGMNMICRAAEAVCSWIQKNQPEATYFLFSGLSSEKRASGFLMTRGKGKTVAAGALVPHKVLKMYLHVTAEQLYQTWHATVLGHLQAGSAGYNAHFANGLTAIFLATGQDVANVVNAACGIMSMEPHQNGLYVSVTLPALSVATVGGGTGLPTQSEALQVMGCRGAGDVKKFAEIVAAAVLGGELSMGAALASGEFAAAHEKYGRNRPTASGS